MKSIARGPRALMVMMLVMQLAACSVVPAALSDRTPRPSITVSPSTAAVDTQLSVEGTGFPPGELVLIHLAPEGHARAPAIYGSATVDESGTFTTGFVLPDAWPGGGAMRAGVLVIIASSREGQAEARAELRIEKQPLDSGPP